MVGRRSQAILMTMAIFSIGISNSSAHADVKPTPSPAPILSPADQYAEAMKQFKIDMKEYQDARVVREQQLRIILRDFNRALRKAAEDALLAGKSAGSKAALAAARAAAASARDEAVALLGPEPVAPTPPTKPMKMSKSFGPSQKPGKKN
jgi:flagellar biosynthesis/type III secretory pathway protein FliH